MPAAQFVAVCCNMLQCVQVRCSDDFASVLQCVVEIIFITRASPPRANQLQKHTAQQCLQLTATHYNTLQHTAPLAWRVWTIHRHTYTRTHTHTHTRAFQGMTSRIWMSDDTSTRRYQHWHHPCRRFLLHPERSAPRHTHMWRDSFISCQVSTRAITCVTVLIHTSHDSFIRCQVLIPIMCVTHRIHLCDMSHSYMWHDSYICMTLRIQTFPYPLEKENILYSETPQKTSCMFRDSFIMWHVSRVNVCACARVCVCVCVCVCVHMYVW